MKFNVGDTIKDSGGTAYVQKIDGVNYLLKFDDNSVGWFDDRYVERQFELVSSLTDQAAYFEVIALNSTEPIVRYANEGEARAYATAADAHDPSSPGYEIYKITRELVTKIAD